MSLAGAVFDFVAQHSLSAKAEFFKNRPCTGLIQRHTRHHFLDTQAESNIERLAGEEPAHADLTGFRRYEDSDLSHMPDQSKSFRYKLA